MNINLYLEDSLAQELAVESKRTGKARNTLIRMAIKEFLAHQLAHQWPRVVLDFQGVEEFTPFETYRSELKKPKEDPFE